VGGGVAYLLIFFYNRAQELAGELSGQLASARRQEKQLRRESAVQVGHEDVL
jgi:hypothetical protein